MLLRDKTVALTDLSNGEKEAKIKYLSKMTQKCFSPQKPVDDAEPLSHLIHLRLRLLQPSVASEVWGWGWRAALSFWTSSWSTCFRGRPAREQKNVHYSVSLFYFNCISSKRGIHCLQIFGCCCRLFCDLDELSLS